MITTHLIVLVASFLLMATQEPVPFRFGLYLVATGLIFLICCGVLLFLVWYVKRVVRKEMSDTDEQED